MAARTEGSLVGDATPLAKPAPIRDLTLKLHRYVGLVLALFLTIIAGTGRVIAFDDDLERALNSHMRVMPPQARTVTVDDALRIGARLEAQDPRPQMFLLQLPLHVTAIGRRAWQVAVSAFGLVVVGISVTGVVLWWRHMRPALRPAPRSSQTISRPKSKK